MKITFDPKHNVAYLTLRESPEEVETIRLSDELHVDLTPDGKIFGIELLNASEQLGEGIRATLQVINESTGGHCEIRLPA